MAWTFSLLVFVVTVQVFQATGGNSQKKTTLICENGGLPDGDKCICSGNVYGYRCEIVEHRVTLGKEMKASITVELPVTGVECTDVLKNKTSPLYESITTTLTAMEKEILPPYFQGVSITDCRRVNTVTSIFHNVIITLPFGNVSVTDQYEKNYAEVEANLKKLDSCSDSYDPPFCAYGKDLKATKNIITTEKDLCLRNLNILFVDYFDEVIDKDGLSCVSQCDLGSKKRVDCNEGTCQIKKDGAKCFCPNTDTYLYTYSRCRGAVLNSIMYGGVGAAIAVLVIIAMILGAFFYRKKYYY